MDPVDNDTAKKFIEAWMESETLEEAARKTGKEKGEALTYAELLRTHGIALKPLRGE